MELKIKGFEKPLSQAAGGMQRVNSNQFILLASESTLIKLLRFENPCCSKVGDYLNGGRFDEQFIVRSHLQAQRVIHACKALTHECVIKEPEVWLSCTIQLINYSLLHPKVLSS